MTKLMAYVGRILLIYYIYCMIGGYGQVSWRDILAHIFLWICCDMLYYIDVAKNYYKNEINKEGDK